MAKYTKEQAMCNVLARHGFVVQHLDDTQRPDGSYDILIDGHCADLKKTKGAGNTVNYAKWDIEYPNAEYVVFELEQDTAAIRRRIYELKRKGYKFFSI
ncbi:MAG: hypothetical protein IJ761_07730 [Bacteroidales bacterium]|nr:hypothetical protein [Bacteroidales bacterium]